MTSRDQLAGESGHLNELPRHVRSGCNVPTAVKNRAASKFYLQHTGVVVPRVCIGLEVYDALQYLLVCMYR